MVDERVIWLRAASGAQVGMGHLVRTRAVAEALRALGERPCMVLDDAGSAGRLRAEGLDAIAASEQPAWAERPAKSAWLDGFRDWSEELAQLEGRGTPAVLVENRSAARERCARIVYPSLHHRDDTWDRAHSERVHAGPAWIPLGGAILDTPRPDERDLDLLVTFGGSDPYRSTERVLALLEGQDARIAVAVGTHMAGRLGAIHDLARRLPRAEVLEAGAFLGGWMARSRVAITALGTTLYELAYLGVPALVLANYDSDGEALDHYAVHGPHLPLGIAARLTDGRLRARIAQGRARLLAEPPVSVEALGAGAGNAARLLAAGCVPSPSRR